MIFPPHNFKFHHASLDDVPTTGMMVKAKGEQPFEQEIP